MVYQKYVDRTISPRDVEGIADTIKSVKVKSEILEIQEILSIFLVSEKLGI